LEIDTSQDLKTFQTKHAEVMLANNPKFILRNYIAQSAIEKAEKGDFSEVERLLTIYTVPIISDLLTNRIRLKSGKNTQNIITMDLRQTGPLLCV
jgi:uncharacterized protein YdiU (UPF0061 family)